MYKLPELPLTPPLEPPLPRCPVCGDETDSYYKNGYDEIIGCSNCIKVVDAWEEKYEAL